MNEIKNRIKKLQELMSEKGISFYIIPTSDPHGSEYIDDYYKCRQFMTSFTGSAGTLVVSKDEACLFVDGRYHIQAEKETENTGINVYKVGLKDIPSFKGYLKEKANASDIIAFDGRVMMESDYISLCMEVDAKFQYEEDLLEDIFVNRPSRNANRIIALDLEISGKETSKKIAEIQAELERRKADAYFISSLDDICYLFNIRGSDIEYSPVCFSYAYITKDSATLYLQKNTYNSNFVSKMDLEGVVIADYDEIELELFKTKGKNIILDYEYTSAYFSKVLRLGNEIENVNNYELIKKHIKNDIEQQNAIKYGRLDSLAVIEFIAELKSRMEEVEEFCEYSAGKMLDAYRERIDGYKSLSFETICAYAENAAIVHYSADKNNSKKLEKKGLLLIDSGAQYYGATTDITRTFKLGDITSEEKRAYTLVLKGNLKLMDSVFVKGTRCENLDILARESLWKEGLDYRHGTGHGIGSFLNVHEGPYRIGFKIREEMPQPEIEPGMIISDEPGYYENGKFGIRHETQLLCVKKAESEYGEFFGFIPLSLVPFEKDAIDFELLNLEELEILKRYSRLMRDELSPLLSDKARKWLDYNTNYVD